MTRASNDTIVTLEGYIHGETEKAILFEVHTLRGESVADPKKEWFPISQTKRIIRAPKNSQEMDTLVVSEWICKAKGIL